MYMIAICDDEAAELNKTVQILSDYKRHHSEADYKIECFESADRLLELVRENEYTPDLIIMDIYMPDKMGIDAAKELRDMGSSARLIFLTTSKEHALEAFGVEAVQYLVKPVSKESLFPVLDKLLADAEEINRRYILLRIEGRIQRVDINKIVYCEAQGKNQYLHMTDGTQTILRMTMTEIYDMLSQYHEFVRAGIAYIVNLDHIESIDRHELQMDNGKKLFPPRASFQPLREKYFNYYCETDLD